MLDINSFPYYRFATFTLCAIWSWETYLNFRQRQKLKNKKPPKVLLDYELTTQEKFEQSQDYGLDKNTFSLIHDVWELIEQIIWLAVGYQIIWNVSSKLLFYIGYNESNNIIHSLIFVILFSLIGTLASIPFDLYHTFILEEKHGFNKQTYGLFIQDTIKKILISVVLISIILPIILYVIEWGGKNFVYYLWVAISIIILIMMWVIPSVIMPCFYKFEQLKEEDLEENQKTLVTDLNKLADGLSFPLKKLFVMDGSTRSSHSNAFQYGFCNNKRIVLFDTLLEQATTTEIVAILAHELGHWYYSHTIRTLLASEIQIFLMFLGFSMVYQNEYFYNQFGFNNNIIIIGLLLYTNLWAPIQALMHFIMNVLTRYYEYQADQFACDRKFADSLYSGLVKIHDKNKANLDPDWLFSAYHHSHPPLISRLKAIEKISKKT